MRLSVIERQLAAVRQHDGARDRKPETKARGSIHVARLVAAHERFEHEFLACIRNARTVVLDLHGHGIRQDPQAKRHFRTEPDRVIDKVGNAAMQIVWPDRSHRMIRAVISHLVPHVGELIGDELKRAGNIDQGHGFKLAIDPEVKEYVEFMKKWVPSDNPGDFVALSGYIIAQGIAYAVKQCGDDLTRENLLKQATSMRGQHFKMMLPGIQLDTTPEDYAPYQSLRMAKFEGTSWKLLDESGTSALAK